jgi:hypothetical protein
VVLKTPLKLPIRRTMLGCEDPSDNEIAQAEEIEPTPPGASTDLT